MASVNILVRSADGKILLQMRDSGTIYDPLRWDMWGGAVEDGEDCYTAAARELSEELSITAHAADFTLQAQGQDPYGPVYYMSYGPALGWADIRIAEGAGAGFFTRDEIARIQTTQRLRWFLFERAGQ